LLPIPIKLHLRIWSKGGVRMVGKIISAVIAALGVIVAGLGSQACILLWVDEPEMPESLIK